MLTITVHDRLILMKGNEKLVTLMNLIKYLLYVLCFDVIINNICPLISIESILIIPFICKQETFDKNQFIKGLTCIWGT